MNGFNGESAGLLESDDEYYDESDDEAAPEFLGSLVGGAIPSLVRGVGGMFGRSPQRPPLPRIRSGVQGRGIDRATLNTPKGSAVLNLPEKVVTVEEFKKTTEGLQAAINRNTDRLNTVTKDVQTAGDRITAASAGLARMQAEQKRQRKQAGSQSMMNMMIGLMTQQQLQRKLDEHTHAVTLPNPPVAGTLPTTTSSKTSDDNSMLMMLPMMMMGQGEGGSASGGDDNNMMMMAMMMMVMNK